MPMDRERESLVRPGGVLPPGLRIEAAALLPHLHYGSVVDQNHPESVDHAWKRDATVIRLAVSAMVWHRAEVAVWDELATREEAAERDGLALDTWQARREELLDAARHLGRRLDALAIEMAQLAAVTHRGIECKLRVVIARDAVEADVSTGGMHALTLSAYRDALALDEVEIGGRADG